MAGFTVLTVSLDRTLTYKDLGFGGHIYPFLSETVGGFIEAIPLHNGCTMYINEEGKLQGLAINYVANTIAHRLNSNLPDYDYIVGNAVICGPLDGEGNDTSLTNTELTDILLAIHPLTIRSYDNEIL